MHAAIIIANIDEIAGRLYQWENEARTEFETCSDDTHIDRLKHAKV